MGERMTRQLSLIVGMKNDKALQGVRKLKQSVGNLGNELKRIATVGAVAFVGMGTAIMAMGVKFESAMRNVWTLTRQTESEFKIMSLQVRELALRIPKSATDMAKALYQIVSAQIPVNQQFAVLETSAKMAVAGLTETTTAADVLTTVLNAWPKGAYTAQQAADIFFKTIELGKTTAEELGQSLGMVATLAAKAGMSFEGVGAAIASMTRAGLKTDIAITALRATITGVIKGVKGEHKNWASDLGIDFSTTALKAKGLVPFLQAIYDKVGDNIDAWSKLFPNVRAIVGVLPLLSEGMGAAAGDMEAMTDATGALSEAYKKKLADLGNQLKLMKAAFVETGLAIYDIMRPYVLRTVQDLRAYGLKLVDWVKTNHAQIKKFVEDFIRGLKEVGEAASKYLPPLLGHLEYLAMFVGRHGDLLAKVFVAATIAVVASNLLNLAIAIKGVTLALAGLALTPVGALTTLAALAVFSATQLPGKYKDKAGRFKPGQGEIDWAEHEQRTNPLMTFQIGPTVEEYIQKQEATKAEREKAWIEQTIAKYVGPGSATDISRGLGQPSFNVGGLMEVPGQQSMEKTLWNQDTNEVILNQLSQVNELLVLMGLNYADVGHAGVTAMSAALGAGTAYYTTIESMSKAYFTGQNRNMKVFSVLGRQMYLGLASSGLEAISKIMGAHAKEYAGKALAATAAGLMGNPGAFAAAAKYGAAALLFGGGAAAIGGGAAAIRERAQKDMEKSVGPQSLGTPTGVIGTDTLGYPSSGGGGNAYGATVSTAPRTFYINPSFTFQGETIIIGNTGVEDLKASMGEMVQSKFDDLIEEGYFDGMNN